MPKIFSQNMMIAWRRPGVLFFVALFGVLTSCSEGGEPPLGSEVKRVALFQYADSPLYELAATGIIEGLEAKGFVGEENLVVTRFNAMRNAENTRNLAQEVAAGNFGLVLTSGTQAMEAFAKTNQSGNTIQVFGVVANPFNAGVGLEANDPMVHPPHLVGIGSFPPVGPVFELARELYPDLKVVGVVWNPTEINSEEGLDRAREIVGALGIELLEATAGSAEEVGEAAVSLVTGGAEILWIGPDNTVHHAADLVIAAAAAGGIPVMSSLPGDARRGALIDLSHDWLEVGKKIGAMAGDILAGTNPATIAVAVHDDRLRLVLNEGALEGLKGPWNFSAEVLERADEVIKLPKDDT